MPSHFKVVVHVRPKLSCRDCEAVSQPPMPSLPIERGRPGPGPDRPCAGLQVLRPSALEPPVRHLRPRRREPRPVDPGRLGRAGGLAPGAGGEPDRRLRPSRTGHPRRRHADPGPRPRPRAHQESADYGSWCATRGPGARAIRRPPIIATRPTARASAPRRCWRVRVRLPARRRLCRLRQALRAGPQDRAAAADARGVLGPRPARAVRRARPDQVADRASGAGEDRRPVRYRARDQRSGRRDPARRAPGAELAVCWPTSRPIWRRA